MSRSKGAPGARGEGPNKHPVPTAPCVPSLRREVAKWSKGRVYPGVTGTTRVLLTHWFEREHKSDSGGRFAYHTSQREAVETIVYLYEVKKIRTIKNLLQSFASGPKSLRLTQFDDFARYCLKMATGTGKTKVMSLLITWQYLNALHSEKGDFASSFVVLAPNLIVFERLRADLEGGRVFLQDPVIPPEFKADWDLRCFMRDDPVGPPGSGVLFLTNIQQLHERVARTEGEEPSPMARVMGPRARDIDPGPPPLLDRMLHQPGPLIVLNDEAHHTHDDELQWNQIIRRLHTTVKGGILAQFDFSATPRFQEGGLFTWTVFDYGLKQAIVDGLVKRPMKGVAKGFHEQRSEHASTRYAAYLTAGVERWKEYAKQLSRLRRKPVLFVMMASTAEADDVGDYLQRKYPSDFSGQKLLVIHTNRFGDVSKELENQARELARTVDQPGNPVNAIVSVLMLREGWDVQSVTVVVGLRPFNAKADILPEQTIGRGLRLMFRDGDVGQGYAERLDVIGNTGFLEVLDRLESEEDLKVEEFDLDKERVEITTVESLEERSVYDIVVPVLSPLLVRKTSLSGVIEGLAVAGLNCPPLPMKEGDMASQKFKYEGYDFITLKKQIDRTYTIPEPQTYQEVLGFYAKRIAQELKLPSQFAILVPKVKEFLETVAFGKRVSLDDEGMLQAITSNVAQYVTVKTFVQALREEIVEPLVPTLVDPGRSLSSTPPFPTSRTTLKTKKTVFNLTVCSNELERNFARFLDRAEDVARFAKLPERFGFSIEYTDSAATLRYYEPDFVVVTNDGTHYLVETKGREDIDVVHKDSAAKMWCENACRLTKTTWRYLKVPQAEYEKVQPDSFQDLVAIAPLL